MLHEITLHEPFGLPPHKCGVLCGTICKMGIKTLMITSDNPLAAAAVAAEAGVDDFLAEATPEAKLKLIHEHQKGGRLVAMTGDRTNGCARARTGGRGR